MLHIALGDPAGVVRRRAAELAPRYDPQGPTATPTPAPDAAEERARLVRALVDLLDDDECAETAANALGELGHLTAASQDLVVERLEQQAGRHADPLCREAAVAALGSLGAGLASVIAATDDVATVRRRAVIALANFDGPEVDEALTTALDDRDWQVRQAAEDLLG